MTEPIAIPNAETSGTQARCGTPKPDLPPFPTFTQQFFNLGMGNGPIGRDDRIDPIIPLIFSYDLRPNIDTLMLPPPEDKGPVYEQDIPSCSYSASSTSVETVANHFNDMTVSGNADLLGCSDCVVCGKPVQQIQDEATIDYLDKTVVPGETLAETERRKRAFLDGMAAGTFLLVPGGVSQAAACDANWYTVAYGYCRALPGTIPLNGLESLWKTGDGVRLYALLVVVSNQYLWEDLWSKETGSKACEQSSSIGRRWRILSLGGQLGSSRSTHCLNKQMDV